MSEIAAPARNPLSGPTGRRVVAHRDELLSQVEMIDPGIEERCARRSGAQQIPRGVGGCCQHLVMTHFALIIRHQTRPGLRDDVRTVWEAHMAPAIDANRGHLSYFYCFDDTDPDAITAFQVYDSVESSRRFLETDAYAAYLRDVEPLLSGPPQVTPLTPVWAKRT